jgi:SNF2 family DNA or RNA helicase
LDILQKFLQQLNYSFVRLDGKTSMNERGPIIEQFHKDKGIFIFLISTKAGGLGLNLTGMRECVGACDVIV